MEELEDRATISHEPLSIFVSA